MGTVVNDTACIYTREPAGSVGFQHTPSSQLVKVEHRFMCLNTSVCAYVVSRVKLRLKNTFCSTKEREIFHAVSCVYYCIN